MGSVVHGIHSRLSCESPVGQLRAQTDASDTELQKF